MSEETLNEDLTTLTESESDDTYNGLSKLDRVKAYVETINDSVTIWLKIVQVYISQLFTSIASKY